MRVAILLFDGVDLLDVGGPYEVFLTASRLAQRGLGRAHHACRVALTQAGRSSDRLGVT